MIRATVFFFGLTFPEPSWIPIHLVYADDVCCLCIRIALLQQQLDDAAKEIEEMKAARRRQTEMVCVR